MSSTTLPFCDRTPPQAGVGTLALDRFIEAGRRSRAQVRHFEMHWVVRGHGDVFLGPCPHPYRPGSLVFGVPGQRMAWAPGSPTYGDVVRFDEAFLAHGPGREGRLSTVARIYDPAGAPVLRLGDADRRTAAMTFLELRREVDSAGGDREERVRARMGRLLGQVSRMLAGGGPQSPQGPEGILALRFRMALLQHFPRLRQAAPYAELLQVSLRELNLELKRRAGRTASALIHERAVLEAKRLLAQTSLTVSEIGFELQFEDPAYFVRFFRRETGGTPGQFRKSAHLAA